MTLKIMPAEQLQQHFQSLLGAHLLGSEIRRRAEGANRNIYEQLWLTIDKTALKTTVQAIADIHFPHLSVISGCDVGEAIELNYHLNIFYGTSHGEINVTVKAIIPKTDLTIDTITGTIPGAVVSEREKQEFFGLKVIGIPDDRRMFLPDDFPQDVYPWRKDETGIQEDMVKKLYDAGKAEGKKRRETASSEA